MFVRSVMYEGSGCQFSLYSGFCCASRTADRRFHRNRRWLHSRSWSFSLHSENSPKANTTVFERFLAVLPFTISSHTTFPTRILGNITQTFAISLHSASTCHPLSGLPMQFPLHFSGSFILRPALRSWTIFHDGVGITLSKWWKDVDITFDPPSGSLTTVTLWRWLCCPISDVWTTSASVMYLKKCQEYIHSFTCTKRSYFCRPVQLVWVWRWT